MLLIFEQEQIPSWNYIIQTASVLFFQYLDAFSLGLYENYNP